MDFDDTPEQAEFRAEARAWLAANAPNYTARRGRSGAATAEDLARAKAWQKCKAEAGWVGLHWPVEYGGRGLSRLHVIIYSQEEAKYSLPSAFFGIGLGFCAPTMMEYATEEQKRRYLPKLLSGEEIWCQLFSDRLPGRISPDCALAPSATATNGWSTARRFGTPTLISPTTASW